MKIHTLDTEIWLPLPIETVFEFFGDAGNLNTLTPPWLNFQILTPPPITMGVGTLIDYKLRIRGMPIRWQTEITRWDPPFAFEDRMNRGPYRHWLHTHTFEVENGGTKIRDHVDYAVPGWFVEPLVHRLMVAPDLQTIFEYRQQKIRENLANDTAIHVDRVLVL